MLNLAYVFPGQGSQSIGMLAELADNYSLIKEQFNIASDKIGYDIWQLSQHGSEAQLNQTEHTQVAMLTADVAVYNLLKQLGAQQACMMAGHSLGEYAALVCAEAINFSDAVQLVAMRGKLMQSKVPLGKGAMAAIVGLEDEQVKQICTEVSAPKAQVTPANYNAIGQVVIAGHANAVEEAIKRANETGARLAKIIPVSVPCHCPLLTEAAEAFKEHLDRITFHPPKVPVISNVNLSAYESDTQIRSLLQEQLYSPVKWVETIQLMKKEGVDFIIECGPGKILGGLIKRIERTMPVISVNDPASVDQALIQLNVAKKSY